MKMTKLRKLRDMRLDRKDGSRNNFMERFDVQNEREDILQRVYEAKSNFSITRLPG